MTGTYILESKNALDVHQPNCVGPIDEMIKFGKNFLMQGLTITIRPQDYIEPLRCAKCTAIASGDRINFLIRKEEDGYDEFSKVFDSIEKGEIICWYGDVVDEVRNERSGLIISVKPTTKGISLDRTP